MELTQFARALKNSNGIALLPGVFQRLAAENDAAIDSWLAALARSARRVRGA